MTWGDVLKIAGSVAGLLVIVAGALLPAMDERLRRKFASREDMNGMRERLEVDVKQGRDRLDALIGQHTLLDDRVGDLEETTAILRERQNQQWERISEQMENTAHTLDDTVKRIERVTESQHQLALDMERLHRSRGKS